MCKHEGSGDCVGLVARSHPPLHDTGRDPVTPLPLLICPTCLGLRLAGSGGKLSRQWPTGAVDGSELSEIQWCG